MSQNFTIDDTDPSLVWGPGWGIQSPNDPALGNYFESTYHASQTTGANVSLSFSGVAIYLFGSKGPNHGNFSIRYDNLVQLLSAQADTLSYRQLLFASNFPAGAHSVTLTNTDNNHSWVDVDFVTVTQPGNVSAPNTFSSTISPPSVSPTTQVSSVPLASSTVQVSSQSNSNTTTLALAIAFGCLLFFLVFGVTWYLFRRWHCRRGTPSQSPQSESLAETPELSYSSRTALHGLQYTTTPLPSHPSAFDASALGYPRAIYNGVSSNNPSKTQSGVETEERQRGTSSPEPTRPVARPWSPFSMPIGRIFGTTKEDGADSMKSTFLKV